MKRKDLPIIPSDRKDDLHGLEIAEKADLVLFLAGNQFMAMKEIAAEFKIQHPEVKLPAASRGASLVFLPLDGGGSRWG